MHGQDQHAGAWRAAVHRPPARWGREQSRSQPSWRERRCAARTPRLALLPVVLEAALVGVRLSCAQRPDRRRALSRCLRPALGTTGAVGATTAARRLSALRVGRTSRWRPAPGAAVAEVRSGRCARRHPCRCGRGGGGGGTDSSSQRSSRPSASARTSRTTGASSAAYPMLRPFARGPYCVGHWRRASSGDTGPAQRDPADEVCPGAEAATHDRPWTPHRGSGREQPGQVVAAAEQRRCASRAGRAPRGTLPATCLPARPRFAGRGRQDHSEGLVSQGSRVAPGVQEAVQGFPVVDVASSRPTRTAIWPCPGPASGVRACTRTSCRPSTTAWAATRQA